MNEPRIGEASKGALAGAVVGAIGGLFAINIGPAIVERNLSLLFSTPILSLISWFISLPLGWVIGGQLGPRLGHWRNSERVEIVMGAIGGLLPVIAIAAFGWYKLTH